MWNGEAAKRRLEKTVRSHKVQTSSKFNENIFDRCRGIPASEAARKEGLELRRSGNREWACCPFHGEKTASLMFDEKGYFHCFGCGAHGDAVSFIAKFRGVSPREAAARLLWRYGPSPPPPVAAARRDERVRAAGNALEEWYAKEYSLACDFMHAAWREKERALALLLARGYTRERIWDDPRFCDALAAYSSAKTRVEALLGLDPRNLMAMYREEIHGIPNEEEEIIREGKGPGDQVAKGEDDAAQRT